MSSGTYYTDVQPSGARHFTATTAREFRRRLLYDLCIGDTLEYKTDFSTDAGEWSVERLAFDNYRLRRAGKTEKIHGGSPADGIHKVLIAVGIEVGMDAKRLKPPKASPAVTPQSPYHGVAWEGRENRWRAQVYLSATKTADGKVKKNVAYLGKFLTAEDAARAYDAKVVAEGWHRTLGKKLNFPGEWAQGGPALSDERAG